MCGFDNTNVCGLCSVYGCLVSLIILDRYSPKIFGKSIKQLPDMKSKLESSLQNVGNCLPHVHVTDHTQVSKPWIFYDCSVFSLPINMSAVGWNERVGPREISSVTFIN